MPLPIYKGKALRTSLVVHRLQKPRERVNLAGRRWGDVIGGGGGESKEKKKNTPQFRSSEVLILITHQVYYLCSYPTFIMGFLSLVPFLNEFIEVTELVCGGLELS